MANINNSLAKTQQKVGLTAYISQEAVRDQINKVVGGKDGQRFITAIVSAVNTNPALQECTNSSIVSGALLGESLKLAHSPQLGYYFLVPYKNTKTGQTEAQFQISYRGMLQLAERTGQYKKINVLPIKEGELIRFDPLNEEIEVKLIEDEETRENAPTIGYYAMFELLNGFRKSMYWSKAKMEKHALRYSKGYQAKKGYTFWEKDFDAMACKTMIRQLLGKYGVMSIEMENAYTSDMAVLNEQGEKNYVDVVYEAPQTAKAIEQKAENESKTKKTTKKTEEAKEEPKTSPEPAENEAEKALFG